MSREIDTGHRRYIVTGVTLIHGDVDISTECIVDTASNKTLLTKDLAEMLGLNVITTTELVTLAGTVPAEVALIDLIWSDGHKVTNFEVCIVDDLKATGTLLSMVMGLDLKQKLGLKV